MTATPRTRQTRKVSFFIGADARSSNGAARILSHLHRMHTLNLNQTAGAGEFPAWKADVSA
jgi:hypothetical protein